MVSVRNLFDRSTSQYDNAPSHLPPKEWWDELELAFQGLQRSANSLSLALDASLHFSNGMTSFRVVYPRAYFSQISYMVTNTMEFHCGCEEAPHESLLCYKSNDVFRATQVMQSQRGDLTQWPSKLDDGVVQIPQGSNGEAVGYLLFQ
ncbi:unnamed protein product [Fusarium graminearum]|nr:unnamed protein product [Fusarium graminearum]